MDDVIYTQMRRNLVQPFHIMSLRDRTTPDLEDVQRLKEGAQNFAEFMKPKALLSPNVKALLMDEKNYSTPSDHYFGYITKRKLLEP